MSRVLLDYPHRRAGHCGSGALRDLLEWAGLGWAGPPEEGLVFALGGALGFTYLRSAGLTPPIYLVGRGADLEVDTLRRIGAGLELRQGDDPVLGWRWVVDELDAGRPVMVWADIGRLPYLRVRLRMSRHDIVVIGYDDHARTAFVADNDRDDIQEVPYAALAEARASTAFPVPTRHTTFAVTWPSKLPDLGSTAADAFAASATSMRCTSAELVASQTLPVGAVGGSGLGGIKIFANDLAVWPEVFDEQALETALRALPVFIEKAGTGGGLFRKLQARGCATLTQLLRSPKNAEAAVAVDMCALAWRAVARAAVADEPLPSRAAGAARAAARLPALEEIAAAALQSAADSL